MGTANGTLISQHRNNATEEKLNVAMLASAGTTASRAGTLILESSSPCMGSLGVLLCMMRPLRPFVVPTRGALCGARGCPVHGAPWGAPCGAPCNEPLWCPLWCPVRCPVRFPLQCPWKRPMRCPVYGAHCFLVRTPANSSLKTPGTMHRAPHRAPHRVPHWAPHWAPHRTSRTTPRTTPGTTLGTTLGTIHRALHKRTHSGVSSSRTEGSSAGILLTVLPTVAQHRPV